jgi:hypothetical protein
MKVCVSREAVNTLDGGVTEICLDYGVNPEDEMNGLATA